MKAQRLQSFGKPLVMANLAAPVLGENEVLVEIHASGVCHTDLHVCSGHYDLGNGKQLDASQRISLPATPGHEIAGIVSGVGSYVPSELLGQRVLVYPWMGCENCPACHAGEYPNCPTPRFLGIDAPGGYASHVRVAHYKYVLPIGQLAFDQAAPLACAGLTAWSALSKCAEMPGGAGDAAILVVGTGGVGTAVLRLARRKFPEAALLAADLAADRRNFALLSGAEDFAAGETAIADLAARYPGRIRAVIDCVGSGATVGAAVAAAGKGSHIIVVGLFGGAFDLSTLLLPAKNLTLRGSYVGRLDELRSLIELVADNNGLEVPITPFAFEDANRALHDLEAGRIKGRAVLRFDGT